MNEPEKHGTPAQGNITEEEDNRTEYEMKNGLVSRKELIKNVPELMEDLNDVDFHSWYHMLWTLSTQRMLERMRQKERNR